MKTVKEYLAEANKMVPKLSVGEAIAWHETGKGIFIDIRDGLTIKKTGTIPGALHIPRGFIEFAADDSTDLHYSTLKRDSTIVLGGRICCSLRDYGITAQKRGIACPDMRQSCFWRGSAFRCWPHSMQHLAGISRHRSVPP